MNAVERARQRPCVCANCAGRRLTVRWAFAMVWLARWRVLAAHHAANPESVGQLTGEPIS